MLRIPRNIYEDIVSHARQEFPIEVCGMLGGRGGIATELYRIRNLKFSTERFLMDPHEQIAAMEALRAHGLQLLAFYHSHSHGPAIPSVEDIRLAFYPEVVTLIISLADPLMPVLRAFRIIDGRSLETDLDVIP